jgi:hypothetical protein
MMTVAATPHTTFFLLSIPLHKSLVLTKVPSNLVFMEDSIFFGIRLYDLLGFGFGSGSSIFETHYRKTSALQQNAQNLHKNALFVPKIIHFFA